MKRPDDLKYTGIEAVFCAHRLANAERFVPIDQAGLVKWGREKDVRLWQAVVLHSFLDPDAFGASSHDALEFLKSIQEGLTGKGDGAATALERGKLQVFKNLRAASDAVISKELNLAFGSGLFDENSYVQLSEFHAWATRVGLPVASGWKSRTEGASERWSWGRHTTPLLEALEAAAKAHWRQVDEGGQYDPADPSSASSNDKVSAWLQERFPIVANETAQVMARILRDPRLPAGRPRER